MEERGTSSASNDGKYSMPSLSQWEEDVSDIAKKLSDFLCLNGLSTEDDISIRQGDFADIALRVDKRRSYFRYFHSIEISERKTSALMAYWVIKFHPISVDASAEGIDRDFACLVNEHFAAYLIIAPCLESKEKLEELFGEATDAYASICSSDYYRKLVYSLRYRNISIDAFVLLAETLVPEVFLQRFEDIL